MSDTHKREESLKNGADSPNKRDSFPEISRNQSFKEKESKEKPVEPIQSTTLYVTSIDASAKEKDLEDLFASYGKPNISNIKVKDHKHYSFVKFSSREDAEQAKEKFHGKSFFGRNLYIDWANKPGPSSEPSFMRNHQSFRDRDRERGRL